uniref:Dolichol-phosphate mannosyltransferase subunit 3 n=1 Tax=Parastrongyloides trichosuri TaxID=131310 RepID=A0A0N5A4G3_PARTI
MATQLALFLSLLLPLFLIWLGLVNEWIPIINQNLPLVISKNIKYAPIYGIFGIGVYVFISMVIGVITFNECKAAHVDLMKEVEETKRELRQRKIID